jgi:hypothetical protein
MSVRSASRAGASHPGPRVEHPSSVRPAAGQWTEVHRYKQRQVPPGLLCVSTWINPSVQPADNRSNSPLADFSLFVAVCFNTGRTPGQAIGRSLGRASDPALFGRMNPAPACAKPPFGGSSIWQPVVIPQAVLMPRRIMLGPTRPRSTDIRRSNNVWRKTTSVVFARRAGIDPRLLRRLLYPMAGGHLGGSSIWWPVVIPRTVPTGSPAPVRTHSG